MFFFTRLQRKEYRVTSQRHLQELYRISQITKDIETNYQQQVEKVKHAYLMGKHFLDAKEYQLSIDNFAKIEDPQSFVVFMQMLNHDIQTFSMYYFYYACACSLLCNELPEGKRNYYLEKGLELLRLFKLYHAEETKIQGELKLKNIVEYQKYKTGVEHK
ncbi:hypothetical protein [Candidatus Uabimicrobium sp. HlEnr_7]|uniref:hypothetical protein n=1 Tax=Candidatus Uabimicrobium helgolandensis TaxID=3095367 RepID=UPI003556954B